MKAVLLDDDDLALVRGALGLLAATTEFGEVRQRARLLAEKFAETN